MRRLLSILLTAIFLLPLLTPLMALGQGDAGLPACCRRNGQHHCMMNPAERERLAAAAEAHGPRWLAPVTKCPYCPAAPITLHSELLAPPVTHALSAGAVSLPAAAARAQCAARVAQDRARQKRGPPAYA